MITRSNLADQLREYQVRYKHDWTAVSFFSSSPSTASYTSHSSRVGAVVFVIWELVILAFLVFSAVSLYFRHIRLAFTLVSFTLLLFVCMKITKRIRSARKRKQFRKRKLDVNNTQEDEFCYYKWKGSVVVYIPGSSTQDGDFFGYK